MNKKIIWKENIENGIRNIDIKNANHVGIDIDGLSRKVWICIGSVGNQIRINDIDYIRLDDRRSNKQKKIDEQKEIEDMKKVLKKNENL